MEVSFHEEIKALRMGAGEVFHGEGILAITKGLLQSGVSYVGGYQGAPVSHLLDVMVQAKPYMDELGIGLGQVRAGKLKLLAVGSLKRSPLFPNVPTLDEVGLKGFDADSVFGFYAPAGTPSDVVNRVNREINKILGTQALKDRIQNLGGEALPLTPAEFGARAADDSKRFGAIIRERKISGD